MYNRRVDLKPISLAIIGCGQVVQKLHLPALKLLPQYKPVWFVDPQPAEAEKAAEMFRDSQIAEDFSEIGKVDAVLIAAPNRLHVSMCEYFINHGTHVLCEKPLALTGADARRLVKLADSKQVNLCVGVFRRYYPAVDFLRDAVAAEWLGSVQEVRVEEGVPYDWELKSTAMMDISTAGGGVLLDTGSHTLDQLFFILGIEQYHLEEYKDDADGGLENDCVAKFSVNSTGGREIPVEARLSRIRKLNNELQIRMTEGSLYYSPNNPAVVQFIDSRLRQMEQRLTLTFSDDNNIPLKPNEYFKIQLADFAAAINADVYPRNAADTNLLAINFIEECYQKKDSVLVESWQTNTLPQILGREKS